MTKAAIICSGFVGRAWAISFARAGCEVALWDQDKQAPGKALAYIERLLPDLEANDLLNGGKAREVAARIHAAPTLESALEGADHVQENTPEDVEVKRELDGFVMNRLQGALLEEAFRLVDKGYAGIEDVDVGIREGLALRWSFMGPFETIDLNAPAGVRHYAERYQGIYSRIFPSSQWRVDWSGPVMDVIESERRKTLPADKLGERQAWRDRRLIALAAHKRRAEKDIGR